MSQTEKEFRNEKRFSGKASELPIIYQKYSGKSKRIVYNVNDSSSGQVLLETCSYFLKSRNVYSAP